MKSLTARDWLQVGDAAALLGVTERTLRNWDKSGKLRPVRHPINGYRIYKAADLHALKRSLSSPTYFQQTLDFGAAGKSEPKAPSESKRSRPGPKEMHWRAEVALDPKHRPQLWDKPATTVRRDWRKYPQEAHVLDRDCKHYRRLTPIEIAALQGFDPSVLHGFEFTNRQLIAAVGNAVPPPLATAVLRAVGEARDWRNRTSLEICAGIGGLTRGAVAASFEHLACLDIDPVCIAFLQRMPELVSAEILEQDLRYAHLERFKDKVGLLCGGPPCQPWSSGGLRRGSEDDRDVLGEMPNLIGVLQPEAFVFENVAGLTTGQNKRYFNTLMQSLKNSGGSASYGVFAAILNAADYGVPQVRERVFIIGLRDQSAADVYRCFERIWASRTHRDPRLADSERPEWKTVGDVLEKFEDQGVWRAWFGGPLSDVEGIERD